ncbi:hypothetical protein K504DRAFT_536693 [Pleomassaria siparia CBS 279.74]|uniref:Uncharacterized protein n=1 Tax=Pleomassaria siparia CBS 279.74 TaxID=1314801 RepID=A0A6G1K1T1_9PLEO|nr:hypothetical protein K504DRAFT_536693 [Pleomassaria siparia CBS 279.74]
MASQEPYHDVAKMVAGHAPQSLTGLETPALVIKTTDLKPYTGTYSCHQEKLRENVKVFDPAYDEDDPKTWPYITQDNIRDQYGINGALSLPMRVAYDRGIATRWHSKYPSSADNKMCLGGGVWIKLSFYLFPFVFDVDGKLREREEMTGSDYAAWMRMFTGAEPACNESVRGVEESRVLSPRTAYEQVMEMLNTEEMNTAAEVGRLQSELIDRQTELLGEKRREETRQKAHQAEVDEERKKVDMAETRAKTLDEERKNEAKRAETAEAKAKKLKEELMQEIKRTDTAEAKVKSLDEQRKKEAKRAEAAETRARAFEQQNEASAELANSVEVKLKALEKQRQNASTRVKDAESRAEALEQKLEECNGQLSLAKKEIGDADQRLMAIHAQMMKAKTPRGSKTAALGSPSKTVLQGPSSVSGGQGPNFFSIGHLPQVLHIQNVLKIEHPEWTQEEVRKKAGDLLRRIRSKQSSSPSTRSASPKPNVDSSPHPEHQTRMDQHVGINQQQRPATSSAEEKMSLGKRSNAERDSEREASNDTSAKKAKPVTRDPYPKPTKKTTPSTPGTPQLH